MRRILLLGMVVLLGMVASPSYGQVDPDEVFTIFEWDFADGQGDFTTRFDWDEMGHWGQEPPTVQPWQYDAENGWMVSSVISSEYMSWYLNVPLIDFTDKGYYDTKLSFEYAIQGDVFIPSDSWDNGSNYIVISCGSKGKSYRIPNIVYNAYQRYFTTAEIDLDEYVGYGKLRIEFDQNPSAYNNWYIKKVKVTGKHKYGKQPFTLVRSVSELKELASNTPVKYINPNLTILLENRPAFVRDNTGAMALTEGVRQWMGTLMTDTIYALYTRENGYTELKYVDYNWNYDDPGDGNASPIEISESDYMNYECNHVIMPITEEVYIVDNDMGYGVDIEWYQPHNTNTKVCGFVYPIEGNRKVFMRSSWSDPIKVVMSEEGDNVFTQQDIDYSIPFSITRQFELNQWYTICTPFAFQPRDWFNPECVFAEFVGAEDGTLTFQTVNKIEAGKPYLIKFTKERTDNGAFGGIITNSNKTPKVVYGGDYNFVGCYNPVQPADGSYYLTANNTIRPLSSGGTIKGFRAYFEPAIPNAAKARALSIDGVTTAIEDIVGGEELLGIPQKVYNVNGQYAGDDLEDLPKGVYIVNGKKIIK